MMILKPEDKQNRAKIQLYIESALIAWDEKQKRKAGYNRYALGLYLKSLQENFYPALDSGASLRAAVLSAFHGRLADVCLKALGEPLATKAELRGW